MSSLTSRYMKNRLLLWIFVLVVCGFGSYVYFTPNNLKKDNPISETALIGLWVGNSNEDCKEVEDSEKCNKTRKYITFDFPASAPAHHFSMWNEDDEYSPDWEWSLDHGNNVVSVVDGYANLKTVFKIMYVSSKFLTIQYINSGEQDTFRKDSSITN